MEKNIFFKKIGGFLLIYFIAISTLMAQSLPDFVSITKTEKQKVVHISTTSKAKNQVYGRDLFNDHPFFKILPDPLGPQQNNAPKNRALGSGFFYTSDGYIVTNNHVIEDAETIEVILNDERSFKASVVGADKRTDLALLKIEDKEGSFPAVKFGNSDDLEIGQWVIAIGNPLGLDQTVTAGIVSAKGRDIMGGTAYGQFIQTDAAINFGNSGGPLIDTKGEVIGINTAITSSSEGIGFAIPSNVAVKVIEQLKNKGLVTRGWLGIGLQELTPEITESLKLKNGQRGVLVSQVFDDSPAQSAGLETQDIIISLDNKTINGSNDLQLLVAETPPGKTITLGLVRNKKYMKLKVKIAEFKEEFVQKAINSTVDSVGLQLGQVTTKLKEDYNLSVDKGLLVLAISPNSPLAEKLNAGDVILKLNNQDVKTVKEFENILSKVNKGSSFLLLINREGFQVIVSGKLQ